MLNDTSMFTKVIIVVGYTDLRRGIEGLATTIKSKYHLDPHEKNVLFLFLRIAFGQDQRLALRVYKVFARRDTGAHE